MGVWKGDVDLTGSCQYHVNEIKLVFGHELGRINDVDAPLLLRSIHPCIPRHLYLYLRYVTYI